MRRAIRVGLMVALVSLPLGSLLGGARTGAQVSGVQQGGSSFPQTPSPILRPPPFGTNEPAVNPALEHRMENSRNSERQKRLVADSDKLLELATRLHEEVAKTDKNILSIDVVKRADEIERLARSVKERMKG